VAGNERPAKGKHNRHTMDMKRPHVISNRKARVLIERRRKRNKP